MLEEHTDVYLCVEKFIIVIINPWSEIVVVAF